ncbi:hypothetical protein ABEV34_21540 [Methylorubrum rhodesianum]|uniref:hypothetical protein n=1 Tax=Methylorubrum rhodesianum TaxID=29427 RepID=UPI003D2E9B44
MSASPFGFGASMAPEDLARLFGRMPIGAPQGFAPIAENEADVQRLERATGMVPASSSPAPRAGLADVAASSQPGAMTVPLPPARPPEFSTPDADAPAAGAVPIMAAPAAASPASPQEPSLGDRFLKGLKDNGDYLGALGAGLLSSPTWAGGISAGIQLASKGEKDRAVTDLAKAEYGLKARKLAQETGALKGNAAILKKAYPFLSDEEAAAQGSNSSAVTEAFKVLRDPNHGRENDPAVIFEKAKAQAGGANAAKPDESYVQLPEQERVSLGLPAGAYQRDSKGKISPVNPTGTTINMGAEKAQDAEIGKAYGKQFVDYQQSGRNAGAKLNTLALMEQAMKMPGFYSGTGGEAVQRANQFLGALGIRDPKAASGMEVFSALGNQAVLDQLGGSLGPGVSNTDRDYITTIGPSLSKTPEGNRQLIGMYRSLAQREQQVAQMARDYAKRNGGRLDFGFDEELTAFATANPLFPAAKAAATAQSDGVTGPTAAGGIPAPRTQADFDALPKGAMYVDPSDGKKYRKN